MNLRTYPCDECSGTGKKDGKDCPRIRCVGGWIDAIALALPKVLVPNTGMTKAEEAAQAVTRG